MSSDWFLHCSAFDMLFIVLCIFCKYSFLVLLVSVDTCAFRLLSFLSLGLQPPWVFAEMFDTGVSHQLINDDTLYILSLSLIIMPEEGPWPKACNHCYFRAPAPHPKSTGSWVVVSSVFCLYVLTWNEWKYTCMQLPTRTRIVSTPNLACQFQ